jgi:hypothetical protein
VLLAFASCFLQGIGLKIEALIRGRDAGIANEQGLLSSAKVSIFPQQFPLMPYESCTTYVGGISLVHSTPHLSLLKYP